MMRVIETLTMSALRLLPPETAHRATIAALGLGLAPAQAVPDHPILATNLWGRALANPIGLAAGFDKDGEGLPGLARLGFGALELGTVTPLAQAGNPRPRLFRLPDQQAVINRLGFNNAGHAALAQRLGAWRATRRFAGLVGVNIGRNKESPDAMADYVAGVRTFASLADYLVVNVSSPNTPGLRDLQATAALTALVEAVLSARDGNVPVLVKLSPDMPPDALEASVAAAIEARGTDGRGIDGLVLTNTTITRPANLPDWARAEAGGLSGSPLFAPATEALRRAALVARGRVPLIGVGGVASGADAYAKIRAGATLVQLYTALVWNGPGLVGVIKRDLAALLRRDGFASVAEAVGCDLPPC